MKKFMFINAMLVVCIFCAETKAQKEVNVYNLIGKKGDTVQVMTLNDLFEYQKECYNDSTKQCYRKFCDWTCEEIICDCDAPKQYIDVWVTDTTFTKRESNPCFTRYNHKQATLEGFVVWLRKKYYH